MSLKPRQKCSYSKTFQLTNNSIIWNGILYDRLFNAFRPEKAVDKRALLFCPGTTVLVVLVRITACLKLVNLAHPNANLLTLLHRCPQQRIVGSCVLKAWRPSVGAPPGKERVGHDQLLPSLQGGCHFQGMVTFCVVLGRAQAFKCHWGQTIT